MPPSTPKLVPCEQRASFAFLAVAALLVSVASGTVDEIADDGGSVPGGLGQLDLLRAGADLLGVGGALQQVLDPLKYPDNFHEQVRKAVAKDPSLSAVSVDCTGSLLRWSAGLKAFEPWAMQMVDSSSKLITGVLYGNLADLGNFDECVSAGGVDVGFSGRYALLSLDIQQAAAPDSDRGNATDARTRAYLALVSNEPLLPTDGLLVNGEASGYSTLVSLRMAVCVPSTCHAPLLETVLGEVVDPVNRWLLEPAGFRLQGQVPEAATAIDGPWRESDFWDWFVIILCVIVVLLVICGTTMDIALHEDEKLMRRKGAALLAFSVWTNGSRLLAVSPASDTNFTCISGLRFLSSLYVILNHRYISALQLPFQNLLAIPERANDASFMVVTASPLSVDTFFLIGGMVNCYSFMRAMARAVKGGKSFDWVMYYVHRYIRLTPALALMVAITATWISLLSTGPLWYSLVGGASDNCRRNWWSALLYLANYVNPEDQCMMQSWYLMVDMQLHWLSPLLLYPLWRWRRAGLAWLCVVVVITAAVPTAITYVDRLPSPIATDPDPSSWPKFNTEMYYPMHTRATPYVIGTAMGYLLYQIKTGKLRPNMSRIAAALGWLGSAALCLTVVFAAQPLFNRFHHPYHVWEACLYTGLHRIAWALGVSWVVMACILGYGGPVNALLSWTPFTVLGRLSYGIYLTHAAVQMVDAGTARTSDYYSDFNMVKKMLSDAVFATILGAALFLCMESPVMAIEKIIFKSDHRGSGPAEVRDKGVDSSAFREGGRVDPEKGEPSLTTS